MKKLGVLGILGIVFISVAAVFLGLCIFTDINDDLFLPLALGGVCVGSSLSLAMQINARRKAAKKDEKNK